MFVEKTNKLLLYIIIQLPIVHSQFFFLYYREESFYNVIGMLSFFAIQ